MGAIPHTDSQSVHVRFGDASRRRHYGSARIKCSAKDPEGVEALMPDDRERIVIIGGGHNGLITAFYLAKAGFAPIVLERSAVAGGSAVTEEIHPGFQCPVLFDTPGPLLPQIVKDLELDDRKLFLTPDLQLTVLSQDGKTLQIFTDPNRT